MLLVSTLLDWSRTGAEEPSSSVGGQPNNAILYGMFTLFACLGGTIVNLISTSSLLNGGQSWLPALRWVSGI